MKFYNVFSTKSAKLIVGGTIFVSAITAANFTMLSAYADPTDANDVASFSGTVDAQCAIKTSAGFDATAVDYTPDNVTVLENTGLSASDQIDFDCNSETVNISLTNITATSPTSTNTGADTLESSVSHTFTQSINGAGATAFSDGSGNNLTGEITDANGDISLVIASAWSTTADELVAGAYSASVTVDITAQ
ncbi:hypothetical protein [Picosynechococcus sp. PCC 73109]|uniref:hypothetical protein n=1 Tax=Picosynechococcus sp. PCC 73109 TaxID=374982 RepID=UPI000745948B|nr:hypothetical protein [Picosynechococcus sp. PCC 73109]AMA10147.1 hypothetical protein AWQ23_12930 [Picosynechococcus sp. PCC 73109]